MTRAVPILALGLLLCAVAPLRAAEADCAPPPVPGDSAARAGVASALPALLDWIAEASGYDVGALRRDPPEIVFCDIGDLIDYEGAGLMVEPYMHAAYDLPAHRIHLVRPWDASDPQSLSELLHELVHVAQLAARDWRCVGEPEWEAYKLQERWLIEQGAPTDFNWLVIYRLSRCPGDGFP